MRAAPHLRTIARPLFACVAVLALTGCQVLAPLGQALGQALWAGFSIVFALMGVALLVLLGLWIGYVDALFRRIHGDQDWDSPVLTVLGVILCVAHVFASGVFSGAPALGQGSTPVTLVAGAIVWSPVLSAAALAFGVGSRSVARRPETKRRAWVLGSAFVLTCAAWMAYRALVPDEYDTRPRKETRHWFNR